MDMRLKFGIPIIISVLLIALTLGAMQAHRSARRRQALAALPYRVPILMYHDISADRSPEVAGDVWTLQLEALERHLQSLKHQGYAGILPCDLAAAARGEKILPAKPVIISFDDGFLSSMTLAEPLLENYGFPAIVYLITSTIAETPEHRKYYRGQPCLTWTEVRDMIRRGTISFGIHSHTHPRHPSDTAREAASSRDLFIANTGVYPYSFCYPHGQYNDEAIQAVSDAGYTTGMVCKDEVAILDHDTNLLILPRVSVYGGLHVFDLEILPREQTGSGVVGVSAANHGLALPVTPRLTGAGLPAEEEWLPVTTLDKYPGEWLWPVSEHVNIDDLQVEVWDTNRILLLYSMSERKPGEPLNKR